LRKPESGTETKVTARLITGLATRDAVEGTGNLREVGSDRQVGRLGDSEGL
jgi:hypothetical protein